MCLEKWTLNKFSRFLYWCLCKFQSYNIQCSCNGQTHYYLLLHYLLQDFRNVFDHFMVTSVIEMLAFGFCVDFRLSFPSGHASFSAYTAVFIVLYMQYAIRTASFQLSKVFVQFVFICLAVACSLSRISDYFHHWSDVLAGFLIGMFSAIYTV